jgi:signal transduction histidine kinase
VSIRLATDDGALRFTVTDAAAPAGTGTGLLGMAAGGALTVESVPGGGTTIRGRLPDAPP